MKNKNSWKKITLWHKIIVFILINVIFLTIFAFIDMYLLFIINPLIGSIITIILWSLAACYHIHTKQKTRIDSIADDL
jgi:hypothetical protein